MPSPQVGNANADQGGGWGPEGPAAGKGVGEGGGREAMFQGYRRATKPRRKITTVSSTGETTTQEVGPILPNIDAAPTPTTGYNPANTLSWDRVSAGVPDTPSSVSAPAPTARRYRVPSAARIASGYGFVA